MTTILYFFWDGFSAVAVPDPPSFDHEFEIARTIDREFE